MAFCTFCGTQVPDDIKFCTSCGKTDGNNGESPCPACTARAAGTAPGSVATAPTAAGSPLFMRNRRPHHRLNRLTRHHLHSHTRRNRMHRLPTRMSCPRAASTNRSRPADLSALCC